MSAIAGGAAIGAGVGVSSIALMPFNSANTFLGSAFFGYGMILGERYMYQSDWPKIQARLEHGEKIENIIQEYTGVFTAVVMKEAKIIFDSVTREMINIMSQAAGLQPPQAPTPAPTLTTPPPNVAPAPVIGGITQPPVQAPQIELRNFSSLPSVTQERILIYMKEISRVNALRQAGVQDAVKQMFFKNILANVERWKRQYQLAHGYKNPTPENAMPWLAEDVKKLLRNWPVN